MRRGYVCSDSGGHQGPDPREGIVSTYASNVCITSTKAALSRNWCPPLEQLCAMGNSSFPGSGPEVLNTIGPIVICQGRAIRGDSGSWRGRTRQRFQLCQVEHGGPKRLRVACRGSKVFTVISPVLRCRHVGSASSKANTGTANAYRDAYVGLREIHAEGSGTDEFAEEDAPL